MQPNQFSPTEAISFGWDTFKKQMKFWVIAALLFSVLSSSGGSRGDFDFTDYLPNDSETTQVEQTSIPPLEQMVDNDYSIKKETDTSFTSLPLVPGRVDQVLGISDKKESGDYLGFIILFIIVVFIFSIPYIIAAMLISSSVQMGFMKFFLAPARNIKPTYEMILSEVNLGKAWRFILAGILYTFLIIFGTILLIIPGIYFAVKYGFAFYYIVDKDAKVSEAFSLSAKATKGNKWNLVGLGSLMFFVNLAGFIALLYGLLVTIPVTMLATAYAYNKLSSENSGSIEA